MVRVRVQLLPFSLLLVQLTSQGRPELFNVILADDFEEHVALFLLCLPVCAFLRLFEIAHFLDVLEVFDVFH
jgi:hypothetical protein